jgi:hypothetical protein
MPQPETRGERRSGQKGPFMDGNKLIGLNHHLDGSIKGSIRAVILLKNA